MPSFTHVHNLDPPDPPDLCEIAVFPVAVVPYALAGLESRIPKYVWSQDGYVRGVQLIRSLQMSLLCGGLKEITERQDALYRMFAGGIYGTLYTVVSSDPLVVTPAIGPTHDLVVEANDSILGRMSDVQELLKNALNGTITDNYTRVNGVRDLLEQLLVKAEAENTLEAEDIAKLVQIIGLLG